MTEREFFDTYCADVFRLCYYMVQNRQDAEDLCQEVFVKALQKDFSSIEKPKQWLFAIAMNTCRTFLKRKKRIVLLEWVKQLVDPRRVEEAYEEKERSGGTRQAVGKAAGAPARGGRSP